MLIVAAEDYTGASPVADARARTTSRYYQDALAANGIGPTSTTSTPAAARRPTHLGVLSHYNAVIWYTGDDVVTREPGWGAGQRVRLAMDEMLQFRAYLNEGGKVLYTGKYAGHQYTTVHGSAVLRPDGGERTVHDASGTDPRSAA